ncbi:ATP-binding protein [Rhizobium sp. NFR12]|uniref:AlbA family DNA-binding domain-containing protein n=1 Tax=Rhizobium sp. NFR12 TaxID=1566261 RepID=UPI0008A7B6C1|nr:ATP-binding protein [Rhizobium sp. NFR12]SEH24135.1 Putative DNA-binding domain-containing protein [Rhizobium sp. NFR12]
MLTDIEQMIQDLAGGETRAVEFKEWMNISKGAEATKIARSISALSNTGGGRLYFGVDDQGRALAHVPEFPLDMFSSEVIHVLLRRHVGELECRVRITEYNGILYPVVHVPRHGDVPWLAPDVNGQKSVFIRSIKPEVVPPRESEQWEELLSRVMEVREQRNVRRLEDGLVARTQELARLIAAEVKEGVALAAPRPTRPDWKIMKALADDTRADFVKQMDEITFDGDFSDLEAVKAQIGLMRSNNVVEGYGLLDQQNELVPLTNLLAIAQTANRQMHSISYRGWSDFITLTDPKVSPKAKYWDIDGNQVTGIEGIRHPDRTVFFDDLDYWRAYAVGVFTICRSFDEDEPNNKSIRHNYLTTNMTVIRTHGILAHAALISRMVPTASRIAYFSYPLGIQNRPLLNGVHGDFHRIGNGVASNEYPFQTIVETTALEADYMGTLSKVLCDLAAPFSDRYPDYFTKERVIRIFDELRDRGVIINPLPMQ